VDFGSVVVVVHHDPANKLKPRGVDCLVESSVMEIRRTEAEIFAV
jgi:hypothetical protein